jgi:WD40 repeat protein
VAWNDGTLREWDGAHDQKTLVDEGDGYADRLGSDRSGARLVTTDFYSNEVRVWDTGTGTALQTFKPPVPDSSFLGDASWDADAFFWDAALTPDGQTVITGDSSGRVIRWDVATGEQLDVLFQSVYYIISQVAVSPDGSQVLAVERLESESQDAGRPVARLLPVQGGGKALNLELEARAPRPEFFRPETVTAAAFSRDGKRVVVGTSEGRLVSFDSRTGGRLRQELYAHHAPVIAITNGPHGQVLSTGSDQRVVVSDASLHATREVASDKDLLAAAFTPDGREVALFASDGAVSVVPLDDAALVRMVEAKVVRDLTPAECQRYRPSQGC